MEPVRRLRKPLRIASYLLFVVVIAEVAVRTYWGLIGGSFLDAPNRMHLRWYPQLQGVEPQRGDGVFDVLLRLRRETRRPIESDRLAIVRSLAGGLGLTPVGHRASPFRVTEAIDLFAER